MHKIRICFFFINRSLWSLCPQISSLHHFLEERKWDALLEYIITSLTIAAMHIVSHNAMHSIWLQGEEWRWRNMIISSLTYLIRLKMYFQTKLDQKRTIFISVMTNRWIELNTQYVTSVFEIFVIAYCCTYYLNESKFSKILNMQILHYLIEYAPICIHFQKIALNIGKSHFQNSCFTLTF